MSSERWLSGFALLTLGLSGACADFSRGKSLASSGSGEGSPDASGAAGSAGSSASYATDIHPLLLDGCGTCHSATGAAAGTALVFSDSASDDYAPTLDLVDVDTPDASRLVIKMLGRGHGGGVVYTSTSPQYAAVLRWIGEGAAP
jgi:hypothetical protein